MSSSSGPGTARRRAAVSCDHCKRRRARCLRPSPGEPCTNCAASQIKCEATVPRKQRLYGSVETLSQRYRALDSLVAGLFPDQDVRGPRGIDALYRLAADRGIEMPEYGSLTPSPDAFASPTSPAGGGPDLGVQAARHGVRSGPAPSGLPLRELPGAEAEEKLIPTTHGTAHYIGPSSSFRLVGAIRGLVAVSPFARGSQRADFVTLNASKALERQDGNDQDDPMGDGPSSLALTHPGQSYPAANQSNGPGSVVQPAIPSADPTAVAAASYPSLPSRPTADLLIGIFFDKVQPNYPLFHRATFQVSYEAIWEPVSPEAARGEARRRTDTGWLCCLYMVFVFGAQLQEQTTDSAQVRLEARALQKRYLDIVRSSLSRLIGTTARANVQALLLLQLFEHNSGQRNASWMFLGCASRMAIALGMHRMSAVSPDIDAAERETRRRVWWTLYAYERSLCVMLGRPTAIDDQEISVNFPDDSVSDSADVPPRYTEFLLRLCRLLGRIKQSEYPAPEAELDGPPPTAGPRQFLRDLDAWYESLPSHLRPEWRTSMPRQRRAILLLQVYHQNIRTLTTLPYLLDRIKTDIRDQQWRPGDQAAAGSGRRREGKGSSQPDAARVRDAVSMMHACLASAEQTLSYLQQLANEGLLDGVSWTDVYYVYHCVLVLCLDLIPQQPDAALSEGQIRRKMAVRSIFAELRRIPLAPTYRILTRVSRQFADIVGAVDDEPRSHNEPNTETDGGTASSSEGNALQQRDQRISVVEQFENYTPWGDENTQAIMNDWFLGDFPSLPWDSFDMGAYATPTSMVPGYGDERMVMGMPQMDRGGADGSGTAGGGEWTLGPLRDMR